MTSQALRRQPQRSSFDGPVGRLSYLTWAGDESLSPILFLHPVNTAAAIWDQVAAAVGDRPAVAVDYRGHGFSDQHGPYFPADFARDALALVNQIGLGRVHLVGGSIGGAVSVEFAARAPQKVLSIALFGATLHIGLAAEELDPMVSALRELGVREWFIEHGGEILGPRSVPDASEQLVELAQGRDLESVVKILKTTFGCADSRSVAQSLLHAAGWPVPALVAVGSADPTCPPAMALELAQALSTSVVVMDGIGHLPMLEAPQQTAQLITEFLAQVDRGRS